MITIKMVETTPQTWDEARPWLQLAVSRPESDITLADLYRSLKIDQRYQLLLFDSGAAVVIKEDDGIHIQALGGEFKTDVWVSDFNTWLKLAAELFGVNKATLCGRKGWARKLRSLGWCKQGERLEVIW